MEQRELKFRAKVNGSYVYSDSYVNLAFYFDATQSYEQEQYTGLKDKNGVEIYVGDILCWNKYKGTKHDVRWFVEFSPERGYKTWSCSGKEDAIVIGNIYENPELLQP